MQEGGSEKKGKKGGSGTEDRDINDVFIVNKIFIKEFYSKRGFYEWKFVVTVDVIPANSN